MKCPKCGSELTYNMVGIDVNGTEHRNYRCKKCNMSLVSMQQEMFYQQRLDKVLSKFTKHTRNYYCAFNMIEYNGVDNKFWIEFDYKTIYILYCSSVSFVSLKGNTHQL